MRTEVFGDILYADRCYGGRWHVDWLCRDGCYGDRFLWLV